MLRTGKFLKHYSIDYPTLK